MKIEGKFIFKVAGTLTAISLVVALLLGLTNMLTGTRSRPSTSKRPKRRSPRSSPRPTASSPRWRRSRRP